MGFLKALRNFLADRPGPDAPEESLDRLRAAWDLEAEPTASSIAPGPDADAASSYDKLNWRKKLHTFFDKFPATQAEWPELATEARALGLEEAWMRAGILEEFTMMIRGLLADRRLSEAEIARIETVRQLIGLPEDQAAGVVSAVVADARRFFGEIVVEE